MNYSKKLVLLIITTTILFTVAVLYVFLKTGSEPATLIGCWFGTFLTELWAISKIKRDKIKHKGGENSDSKVDK